MSNEILGVNINAEAVLNQYQKDSAPAPVRTKTTFDAKNYLNARLAPNENSKTLIIRLLPFEPGSSEVFHEVHMHQVKVNKEVSSSGWKTLVCPPKNNLGDKCPFCELAEFSHKKKLEAQSETDKKRYGDTEFANAARKMWIVRCIERGHESDGVKFWLFSDSRRHDGVYDKIMNIFKLRLANNINIFDLVNGRDLSITLTRGNDKKTVFQVLDDAECRLAPTDEQIIAMVNDQKKWTEVYTVKPYEFMSIVRDGGVPMYDKEAKKYINKEELQAAQQIAEQERFNENFTQPTQDFAQFAKPQQDLSGIVAEGSAFGPLNNEPANPAATAPYQGYDDSLPF